MIKTLLMATSLATTVSACTAPSSVNQADAIVNDVEHANIAGSTLDWKAKRAGAAFPLNKIEAGDWVEDTADDLPVGLTNASIKLANDLRLATEKAAAASDQCDEVTSSLLSTKATNARLRWFVDCNNGSRYIISVAQARRALAGHYDHNLQPSCTNTSSGKCHY